MIKFYKEPFSHLLFSLTGLLTISAPALSDQTAQPAICTTGSFHGDDVAAQTEEEWFGLFGSNKKYALEKVKLSVEMVHDPILDDKESNKTGKKISITGEKRTPLVLLKNIPGLKARKIINSELKKTELHPGRRVLVTSGKEYFYLIATGLAINNQNGEVGVTDYKVSAVIDKKIILLFEHKSQDLGGGMPELVWAGDINGDGRTDLILSTSAKYSVSELTLFYTEQGTKGFKKVSFTSYSC